MPALPKLYRGENVLVARLLTQADKITPLNVASLVAPGTKVELVQLGVVKATFNLGSSPALHVGAAANEFVLELSTATTATLVRGEVLSLRWYLKVVDADFVAEPGHYVDVQEEEAFLIAA